MSETIEKTFNVSAPARLNLSNIRGSVEIHPGEDGMIRVTAVKQSGFGDPQSTEIEMTQEADGTVKVVTRYPEAWWGWIIGSFPCAVDYTVQAPRNCSLTIKGVSNEASAEGFEGEFNFNTVSGNVKLRQLTGPVKVTSVSGSLEMQDISGSMRLHSVSGKITGQHLTGAVNLDTVSGRVELEDSSLSSAEAGTVSGPMGFQTALGAGPYRFNSVSGNVELTVPADTRCSAELHAVSGSIRTQLPGTTTSRQNGMQTVEVQGGGVKIYAHSVSGNLSLVS
jgi:DUF4097 and DUF4098 domain-containing protein YvlB